MSGRLASEPRRRRRRALEPAPASPAKRRNRPGRPERTSVLEERPSDLKGRVRVRRSVRPSGSGQWQEPVRPGQKDVFGGTHGGRGDLDLYPRDPLGRLRFRSSTCPLARNGGGTCDQVAAVSVRVGAACPRRPVGPAVHSPTSPTSEASSFGPSRVNPKRISRGEGASETGLTRRRRRPLSSPRAEETGRLRLACARVARARSSGPPRRVLTKRPETTLRLSRLFWEAGSSWRKRRTTLGREPRVPVRARGPSRTGLRSRGASGVPYLSGRKRTGEIELKYLSTINPCD